MNIKAVGVGLAALLALSGCGTQANAVAISGSPDTVVEKAKDVPTNETPTVEVTGSVTDDYHVKKGDSTAFLFGDNGGVMLIFNDGITSEQADKINGGKFTAKGKLDPKTSSDQSATIVVDEIE